MPSLNQIVEGLAEQAGKPFDIPFQTYMKMVVRNWTVTLTKRTLENKPLDRRFFITSLVVPISRVSEIECPITYGCRFRSTLQVPSPIRTNGVLFDFVGTPDFIQAYGQVQDWQRQFIAFNRITSHEINYIYRDKYLFIDGDKIEANYSYIGVQMIPANFEDLTPFQCTIDCNADDEEFPIAPDLLENVLQSIYATELKAYMASSDAQVQLDSDNKEKGKG
jgi:hypothetical protein